MATIFMEPGGGATGAKELMNGLASGTVAVDTTIKKHGYGSFKCGVPSAASAYIARLACLAAAGRRIHLYGRFSAAFGASGGTGFLRLLTGTNELLSLTVTDTGVMRLQTTSTVHATSSGSALSLDTWYSIRIAFVITTTTNWQFKVWQDGTLVINANSPNTLLAATTDNLRVGWTGTSPAATALFYWQDLYIDDSSALTDVGEVFVTAKRPNAAGDTNAFDTAVGAGTNRWDRVNERPLSTANRYDQAGTPTVRENYTVEGISVGDDDITGKTILDWAAWAWWSVAAAAGNTATALVRGGTDVGQTSTAASGAYQSAFSAAASSTFPSGNNAVGYKSTGAAANTLLAECGVLVAYITPVATISLPPPPASRRPMQSLLTR